MSGRRWRRCRPTRRAAFRAAPPRPRRRRRRERTGNADGSTADREVQRAARPPIVEVAERIDDVTGEEIEGCDRSTDRRWWKRSRSGRSASDQNVAGRRRDHGQRSREWIEDEALRGDLRGGEHTQGQRTHGGHGTARRHFHEDPPCRESNGTGGEALGNDKPRARWSLCHAEAARQRKSGRHRPIVRSRKISSASRS